MVVTLRSGRELEDRRNEKKDIEEEKYANIWEHFKQHSPKTTEEEEQQRCSQSKRWKNKIQGKRNRLRLMNLKFHYLKFYRRQS